MCICVQVYLDFGLAVPLLSVRGMHDTLQQCLHLCPTDKLLFSTDAHFFPEGFHSACKWGRQVSSAIHLRLPSPV